MIIAHKAHNLPVPAVARIQQAAQFFAVASSPEEETAKVIPRDAGG